MADNDRDSSSSTSGFNTKTALISVGVGAVGFCLGPISAAVGVGATLFTRTSVISLSSAFSGRLDDVLRSKARSGDRLSSIQRFSKRIDRLACCTSDDAVVPVELLDSDDSSLTPSSSSRPSSRSPPITMKQDLPYLTHSGLILQIDSNDDAKSWLKIEFAKEGLNFQFYRAAPKLERSYLIESCELQDVSPVVLANCLEKSKDRTYNAITWNCNHVTDMIWDEVLKRNCQGLTADPPDRRNCQGLTADPPDNVCKICFEQPKTTAFIPCGHYETCTACAEQLTVCPICQQEISQRQRIYGS